MKQEISLKFAGSAGQGVKTAGYITTKALKNLGWWTFSYSEYPSLIRGGHSIFQINLSDEKINSVTQKIDILIALNSESIDKHYKEINKNGNLLCDDNFKITDEINKYTADNNIKIIRLTIDEIVKKNKGLPVMGNSVVIGAVWAILTNEYSIIESNTRKIFKKKSKDIEVNINCTKCGFDFVKSNNFSKYDLKQKDSKNRIIGTGNETAGLSTYASGCRFYCAYPMTPSTGILHYLSQRAEKLEIVVKQAEDEITAVQMSIGGSFAGTRSACGTSGGGLALMTESLSLIGMTETPLVVFDSQRPGPATGTPTWTEQGDLSFVVNAGHGDFPKIVIAPGDIDEVFDLTSLAFNLADKYQTLVIVLLDKYLSESWYQTEKFDNSRIKIERGKLLDKAELENKNDFKRYKLTESGISPRSIPGSTNGLFCANSDEHDEYGYSTEDLDMRNAMMEKRMRKMIQIKKDIPEPELYGPKDAKNTIICWGSQKGVIEDAIKEINQAQVKINMLHYSIVYPVKDEKIQKIAKSNNLIAVENNYSAQFSKLLKSETGIDIKTHINKYDGTPFFKDELIELINKNIN